MYSYTKWLTYVTTMYTYFSQTIFGCTLLFIFIFSPYLCHKLSITLFPNHGPFKNSRMIFFILKVRKFLFSPQKPENISLIFSLASKIQEIKALISYYLVANQKFSFSYLQFIYAMSIFIEIQIKWNKSNRQLRLGKFLF